ncbi:MAG: response regulator [Tahibacter sp.]
MTEIQNVTGIAAARHSRLPMRSSVLFGFIVAAMAVLVIALLFWRSTRINADAVYRVTHTLDVTRRMEGILSLLKDAETGQRGFLITGKEEYLEPYTRARSELPTLLTGLRESMETPAAREVIDLAQHATEEKLGELALTIDLQRQDQHDAAVKRVQTDRGKRLMDQIRERIGQAVARENTVLEQRQNEWAQIVRDTTVVVFTGCSLILVLIVFTAVMSRRDHRDRELQVWLRDGEVHLGERLQGDLRLEVIGERILQFVAPYVDASAGAIYVADSSLQFPRFGGYAVPDEALSARAESGKGLLGQALHENRILHLADVPQGYLRIESALGSTTPRELLIVPLGVDGAVQAIVELGFIHPVDAGSREWLQRIAPMVAIAVRSAKDRSRLESLLEETQQQAEELQAQQEELRVSNEELEEQGRALKESQAALEGQQVELEQTNSQLEEQAQQLEAQRDDLAAAQLVLVQRAEDLNRANQYKSEFLANMSHELRTPLNSTLILAKLLGDNASGNLTEEQVKFARTIFGAGNDLLALIDDILDLSKIEAGKVEVQAEEISTTDFLVSLSTTFEPMASEKGLQFGTVIEPGAAERFSSDPQRLGQILKNLLSNAIKFTSSGAVSLRVSSAASDRLVFAVHDSGIGIEPHQQDVIFEAFRQADGSTHRKFGGTGLGLSISRDLAHLLGGELTVQSAAGRGSIFLVTLPRVHQGPVEKVPVETGSEPVVSRAPAPPVASATQRTRVQPAVPIDAVEDDRDALDDRTRRLLIVEDDVRFAMILRDLAQEMGFRCIVTHTAGDGLIAANRYRPSAILLDMNLPDHSGLGVLDQLKRNPETRHIPVHVISVADYTRAAMERGAVGYARKPVNREQLISVLNGLESRLQQGTRRVLVIEDDVVQRDSVRLLLENEQVQITPVGTAQDALTCLRAQTFDCVVMDLNLPDMPGYDLLAQMASSHELPFPPVIVYTGRSLTRDEEQRLQKFSNSIIVKDARSPERLLDEVTLFLHQMESSLSPDRQRMLKVARDRETTFEGRRILVVEDDVRNIFALTSILEPKGAHVVIARNGREALEVLGRSGQSASTTIDLVLMDIMMPEMDGYTAMRLIRQQPEWRKLPIIALTAKAMKDDQEKCLSAGASDYIAKPLDVEKLLSLARVWMPA